MCSESLISLQLEIKFEDNEGVEHCEVIDVPVQSNFKVNLYIHNCGKMTGKLEIKGGRNVSVAVE